LSYRGTNWLLRVTAFCLAIATAAFVLHLGADGHTDECHACKFGAHALDISPPTASPEAPRPASAAAPPTVAVALAEPPRAACPPRAPPIS
jgi:hypothetical protein